MLFVIRWSTCAICPLWWLKPARTYVGWTRSRGSSWRQVTRQEREPVLWKKNMTALVNLWVRGTVRCREFCMHRKSGWMALADAGYKREQVGLWSKDLSILSPTFESYKFWFYKLPNYSPHDVLCFDFRSNWKMKISGDSWFPCQVRIDSAHLGVFVGISGSETWA